MRDIEGAQQACSRYSLSHLLTCLQVTHRGKITIAR